MKCPACGEEVVLAEHCPYCGRQVAGRETGAGPSDGAAGEPRAAGGQREQAQVRGQFRGRLGERPRVAVHGWPFELVHDFLRYLQDPRVPLFKKSLVFLAIFYVLSPIDLLPGIALPFLGWLDDVAVGFTLWRWLSQELEKYRDPPQTW